MIGGPLTVTTNTILLLIIPITSILINNLIEVNTSFGAKQSLSRSVARAFRQRGTFSVRDMLSRSRKFTKYSEIL